ncbi:retrovirus-related pol polyprotein from transposon TNT 1-94, partial [Tanacetum coccineum]
IGILSLLITSDDKGVEERSEPVIPLEGVDVVEGSIPPPLVLEGVETPGDHEMEDVAFCLLEDLTAFCLKISLRFASRPHCVLLQDIHCVLLEDLTAFCLKTSLRFASRPHCVLLQVITAFCFNITAFCSRPYCVLIENVRATNIVLQGLPKDIYKLINHNIEAKAIWDNVKMLLAGSELTKEDRESQLYDEFERFKMLPECSRATKSESESEVCCSGKWCCRQWGAQNRAGNANVGQGKPVKCYSCNGVGHIARNCTQPKHWINQPVQDLALNEDNIFQADESEAFDSDVHTLENAIDHTVTNEVQQSNVIDSTSVYMGNINVIPYEQYLSVNNISIVPTNELKIYKEQVTIYERAKFELTEREQRMDDQMHMLIQNQLLKTHDVLVNVPSFEEELELADATRSKLHVKMNDSACVEKEHFDRVQKSLVTEVRAMKAVFENLEAEVDQNEIDLEWRD